ncbi:MAG: DUF4357 domain-containing protein [Rhodanobacteraceae bacterium]
MHTIDVDFDVFKALTSLRDSEDVSYNDVLRRLLSLPVKPSMTRQVADARDWLTKGVRFPSGTEFRAPYKGQLIEARVENGALHLNGKNFTSPSGAAMTITGGPVNGWTFWECRTPGSASWRSINALRK